MKILGPAGEELAPGEVGEIYMLGDPAIGPTYRYIGAEAREHDGWESLGDLGWMDKDGYLYISDRRTDMILSGGANVYPAEVEAALMEHPLVESVVVVGIPDEDLGQRVHAVVQSRRGLTGEELAAFLSERIVRYKMPRSFTFVDETLRDDAGKARRSAIRDAAIAGQPTHV
jgi:bile acid-coenzyme A ligase